MKTIYWVFAVVVFVVSLAQPAFAGCGNNKGRNASTTATAIPPRPLPPPAQGAGIAR